VRAPLAIALFGLVFVSGCAGLPFFGGAQQTKIVSQDLLKVTLLEVFPQQDLLFDEVFTLRMEVENAGQAAASFSVNNTNGPGVLTNYCEGFFKITSFDSFPQRPVSNRITLNPGESTTLQWTMRAPPKEKSGGVTVTCPMQLNINYDAEARTTAYVYFINPIEAQQRVYTRQTLSLRGDNVATFGPVAVNVETPEQPVATSSTAAPTTFTIFFNMRNLGSGTASVSSLEFAVWSAEKGFAPKEDCLQNFRRKGSGFEVDTTKPANKNLLTIFTQGQNRFGCSMEAPPTPILTPYRFEALAKYNYNLDKSIKITASERRATGGIVPSAGGGGGGGGLQLPGFG